MSGDEILPEHLNLPQGPEPLAAIEQHITHIARSGDASQRQALKQHLQSLAVLL